MIIFLFWSIPAVFDYLIILNYWFLITYMISTAEWLNIKTKIDDMYWTKYYRVDRIVITNKDTGKCKCIHVFSFFRIDTAVLRIWFDMICWFNTNNNKLINCKLQANFQAFLCWNPRNKKFEKKIKQRQFKIMKYFWEVNVWRFVECRIGKCFKVLKLGWTWKGHNIGLIRIWIFFNY